MIGKLFGAKIDYDDPWYDDDGQEYVLVDYTWSYPIPTDFRGTKREMWKESGRRSSEAMLMHNGKIYGVLPVGFFR